MAGYTNECFSCLAKTLLSKMPCWFQRSQLYMEGPRKRYYIIFRIKLYTNIQQFLSNIYWPIFSDDCKNSKWTISSCWNLLKKVGGWSSDFDFDWMEFYFPSRKYNGLLNMEFISLKGVISRSHLLESLKNIKSSKSSLNPFFYWQTKIFTIDWQKLKHVLFFNVFKLTDNIIFGFRLIYFEIFS